MPKSRSCNEPHSIESLAAGSVFPHLVFPTKSQDIYRVEGGTTIPVIAYPRFGRKTRQMPAPALYPNHTLFFTLETELQAILFLLSNHYHISCAFGGLQSSLALNLPRCHKRPQQQGSRVPGVYEHDRGVSVHASSRG